MVEKPEDGDFARAFKALYQREFGFELKGRDILVDDIRVRSIGKASTLKSFPIAEAINPPQKLSSVRCYFTGGWQDTALYNQEILKAGHSIEGPAILLQSTGTILVEPDLEQIEGSEISSVYWV